MNQDKERFFSGIQKYVDDGLLRTIYSDDNLAVVCVGDLFYLICPYFTLDNGDYFGMSIKKDNIHIAIEDPEFFFKSIKEMNSSLFLSKMFNFSYKYYDVVKSTVDECHKKGDTVDLDYQFEENLKQLYVNKTK